MPYEPLSPGERHSPSGFHTSAFFEGCQVVVPIVLIYAAHFGPLFWLFVFTAWSAGYAITAALLAGSVAAARARSKEHKDARFQASFSMRSRMAIAVA